MAERAENRQFDSFYYQGTRRQVESLVGELFFQGFVADNVVDDLDSENEALLLRNENGDEVLIYKDDDNPQGQYTMEIDAPLTLLVEESLANPGLDKRFLNVIKEARELDELDPPPSDPALAEQVESFDKFHVWEDKTEEEIKKLQRYLDKNYPELRKITGQLKGIILEEDMVIYKKGDDLIFIYRQLFTENPHLFRVKVNPALLPILEDYWGRENTPPIYF